ncbi:MAG: hypothetical protein HY278_06160 [candidate division NC10 bacterium]|nr:hypothetical protein [candidate division NC10 bacterium]
MKSKCSSARHKAVAVAAPFLAMAVAFTCLGLASGIAIAQHSQTSVKEFEDFDSKNFDRSTHIDNEWFPLKPGTRFVYEGFTIEDGKRLPHRVVFTVTDLTKVIGGVRAVVGYDLDYSAGQLAEKEIIFFAQDNGGTVWHLGQYPEVYENGKFVEAPAWIHGIQDAKAGIVMKAEPRLGTPSYSQGLALAVNWTDRGVVYQVGQKACVPLKCYEDVLVIDESSREEPGAHHLKYYARGVGNVRVGWRGEGDKTRETLELVKVVQLGPQALAAVRAEALELEKRAYKISKKVYVHTTPAEHTPGAKGQ